MTAMHNCSNLAALDQCSDQWQQLVLRAKKREEVISLYVVPGHCITVVVVFDVILHHGIIHAAGAVVVVVVNDDCVINWNQNYSMVLLLLHKNYDNLLHHCGES